MQSDDRVFEGGAILEPNVELARPHKYGCTDEKTAQLFVNIGGGGSDEASTLGGDLPNVLKC